MKRIPALYPRVSLGTRAFLEARWSLTPYTKMASEVPATGKVLDLGCGHGLFALAMATGSPSRDVLGIDHDEARVSLANEASKSVPNAKFAVGNVPDPLAEGKYSAITLIDVMHYFDEATQRKIIANAYRALMPGGRILIREVDPAAGAASAFNKFYEKVATGIGFTRSKESDLHFRSPGEWQRLLLEQGFQAGSKPCSFLVFADVLFIGIKSAPAIQEGPI